MKRHRISTLVTAAIIAALLPYSSFAEFSCTFNNDTSLCLDRSLTSDKLKWSIMKASQTPGRDLPKTDGDGQEDGGYAFLEIKDTIKAGDFALLKTPIIVRTDYVNCVNFQYYLFGTRIAKIQLIRNCYPNSTNPDIVGRDVVIWQTDGTSQANMGWNWALAHISNDQADQCELIYRAEVIGANLHGIVAIDNIIPGPCIPKYNPPYCNFELPCGAWDSLDPGNLPSLWPANTTAINWVGTTPRDLPPLTTDHTSLSAEGGVFALIAPDSGCYSAQMVEPVGGQLNPRQPSYCVRFFAKAVTKQGPSIGVPMETSAAIYIHLLRLEGGQNPTIISTPWIGRLNMDPKDDTWSAMHAYIDLSWVRYLGLDAPGSRSTIRFVVEGRFCSPIGGGIAIDDLSTLAAVEEKHCRLQGDEDFENTMPFWETVDIDSTGYSWVVLPSVHSTTFPLSAVYDHSFSSSKAGNFYASEDVDIAVTRMRTAGTLDPTHGRCVSFWMLINQTASSLSVRVVPLRLNGVEPNEVTNLVYRIGPSNDAYSQWQLHSFSYYSRSYHKLVVEVTGGFMLDDFTFNEGVCSCKPQPRVGDICQLPDFSGSFKWPPYEVDTGYSRVGDCPADAPMLAVYQDISLVECDNDCRTIGADCKTFVYGQNTRTCELKSSTCPNLISNTNKRVYEQQIVSKYYGLSGECANTPSKSFGDKLTQESCADECNADKNCGAFVYRPSGKECFLHYSPCLTRRDPINQEITFEKIDFQGFVRFSGSCDITGETLKYNSVSRRKCSELCRSNVTCAAFIYDASRATCITAVDKSCALKAENVMNSFTYIKTTNNDLSCDFEDMSSPGCSSWNILTDNENFTIVSAEVGYGTNGPRRDVTFQTNDVGHYLLLPYSTSEDADDGSPNTANFASTLMPGNTAGCLSFWYYMFGPSIGALSVYIVQDEQAEKWPVWQRVNSQGDVWINGQIDLISLGIQKAFKVIFEAEGGSSSKAYLGGTALDNITTSPHACLPTSPSMCTFEGNDGCVQISVDPNTFSIVQASQLTANQGPKLDRTYQTALGHFALARNVQKKTVFAIKHDSRHERCATFWYQRGSKCLQLHAGVTADILRYRELLAPSASEPGSDSTPDDITDWKLAYMHLPAFGMTDAIIEFHAELAPDATGCDANANWLAIDEILVLQNGCPRDSVCNFETQTCSYSSDTRSPDNMPWLLGVAPGLNRMPAPKIDNTLSYLAVGSFSFIDQLVHRDDIGETALLKSQWIQGFGLPTTVSFYYYITGPESGVLEVFVLTESDIKNGTKTPTMVWHIDSRSRESTWQFGRFSVAPTTDLYQITFKATRGTNSYALLAVDDITVLDGLSGSVFPQGADPSYPLTTRAPYKTTTPITPYPTFPPDSVAFSCDFEKDACGFAPLNRSTWARVCGNSPDCSSNPKGPISDHTTGQGKGFYYYLTMNSYWSTTALELSKSYTLTSNQKYCLSFWYYAYGSHVELVSSGCRYTSAKTNNYWQRTSSQGQQWKYVEYTIDGSDFTGRAMIYFSGQRSSSTSGYFAIDDVVFANGACPRRAFECSFEDDATKPCGSTSTTVSGDAQWQFGGSTPDHTLQTKKGHYAYISSTGKSNYTAQLSQVYSPVTSAQYCLQYWYKLGPDSSLVGMDVCVDDCNSGLVTAGIAPNSGIAWTFVETDLASRQPDQFALIFRGRYSFTGSQPRSQTIAVDDIKILAGPCENADKCSFEQGLCGWTNDATKSQFDWLLGAGLYGGPIALDHTSGVSEGHYVFAPLTPPRKRGDVARIISPVRVSENTGCLRFFFWSASSSWKDSTSLRMIAVSNAGERTIWFTRDRSNAQWQAATAAIDVSSLKQSYQIAFEATFDSDEYSGALAIDDVFFDKSSPNCPSTPGGNDPSILTSEMLTCTFADNTFCLWQPASGDPTTKWALQVDPVDQVTSATVVYSVATSSFNTSLNSPVTPGNGDYCFEFYYALHGSFPGKLTVALQSGVQNAVLWARTGSQGYKYRRALVPFNTIYDFSLSFNVVGTADSNDTLWSGTFSIRRTNLYNGACPSVANNFCDFESSLCDWKGDSASNTWKRAQGLTDPPFDHTTGTQFGHLAAVNGTTRETYLTRTTITKPSAEQCITFWHYVDSQATPPKLRVYGDYKAGSRTKHVQLWYRNVTTLGRWDIGYAKVPADTSFSTVQLSFSGENPGTLNALGVDDISIQTGRCPAPMACDWEESMCGYQQTDPTKASMIWTSAGSTDTSPDAPKVDHTSESAFGHYLYVGASSVTTTDAEIHSPLSGSYSLESCVEVWYQLSGAMILQVTTTDNTEPSRLNLPTNGAWWRSRTTVLPNQQFRLGLSVTRRDGSSDLTGFVAIDDVIFRENATCDSLGPTTPSTTIITTIPPISGFSCDFATDWCGWTSDNSTVFAFQRGSGKATQSGPDGDVQGTGYYLYMAASWENNANGTARIVSPQIKSDLDGSMACFQFYYFLNGRHVDTLSIYDVADNDPTSKTVLWSRSKEQGRKWILGHLELNATVNHKLAIEASKLTGANGVMGLDDFAMTPGLCPPFRTCDFEDHKLCNWVQDPDAKDDWLLVQGRDKPKYGPEFDHTYGTGFGSYIHVGGDSTAPGYNFARLLSREYRLAQTTLTGCLRMWIHTAGTDSPLNVVVSVIPTDNGIDHDEEAKAIFSMTFISPTWRRLSARIDQPGTFRLSIEATGDFTKAGASVDDVDINIYQSCGLPADCDFENGQCGWQNKKENFYDWTDNSGPTDTPGTGPTVDHTLGTADGTYMYLESSTGDSTSWRAQSIYESELISPFNYFQSGSQACFRFWYHMYGGIGMGSLEVLQAATGNSKVYWTKKGNQGNEWRRALVDIDVSAPSPIILQLRGTIGQEGQSDMAIDDTVLLPGDCQQYNDTIGPHQIFNCSRPRPDGQISIPLSHRCDFVPDCPDGEDELGCGFSCDFDTSPENCTWMPLHNAVSNQFWDWGHGSDNATAKVGPAVDHTTNTSSGGYEYIAFDKDGTRDDYATFVVQLSPTADTCMLSFWYNIYGPYSYYSWGNIDVTLGLGDTRFDIDNIEGPATTVGAWKYYSIKIGRIHTGVTLMLRGEKEQPTSGVVAIDDLALDNCTFPLPRTKPCDATEFRCVVSGACVSKSVVCDLADDCGDGSDEADCSTRPFYCNFETDTCGFMTVQGSWLRTSNSYMSHTTTAPMRDHTTGLYYGYSMYSNYYGTHVIRSKTTFYIKQNSACSVRFFYQLGTAKNSLQVHLLSESDGKSTAYGPTLVGGTGESWVKGEVNLASFGTKGAFAVEFWAVNSNSYSGFVAIDDITMSADCFLNDNTVCLPPNFYRCQSPPGGGQGACLSSSYVGDFTIDCPLGDDEWGYGPCTFDPFGTDTTGSMCKWNQTTSDNSEGGFGVIQTNPSSLYDPKTDGPPTSNPKGWFLHAGPRQLYDDPIVTLTSPPLPAMAGRCSMNLAVWLYGANSTETLTLTYKIKTPTSATGQVVSTSVIRVSSQWQTTAAISFKQAYPAKSTVSIDIVPTNVPRNRNEAVIGIDNIAFIDCSVTRGLPEISCTFEDKSTCAWTQDNRAGLYSQIKWQFGDGSQAAQLGGPGTPYGTSSYYLFISEKLIGSSDWYSYNYAWLNSPWYEPSKDPYCMQFAYHIFGSYVGSLNVRLYTRNSYDTVFSRTTSQGNQWRIGQVTIVPPKERYYIMFYASTGTYYQGHAAIDNITILRGECDTRLSVCDFETNTCGWTSNATDPYDFTWQRMRHDKWLHSNLTGAQQDHTTESSSGYFMQIEAQDRMSGDRAGLVSPVYAVPKGAIKSNCFSFWYHMYGTGMGQLSVNVYPTKNRRVTFARSGNHGNHWWQGKIEVKTSDFSYSQQAGNYRVALEAVVGNSPLGDIAIDDAGLTNGSCPALATCDFEQNQCGWSNVYEVAQVTWLRNNNATFSRYSGPSSDHTYMNSSGYYMFIDSSSQSDAKASRRAYYASEIITGSPVGHCFKFWYHMFGTSVGTLSIQLLFPTRSPWQNTTVWSRTGSQGSDWQQGKINVFTSEEYSLVFVANMTAIPGGGDIAIDDLALDQSGPCPDVTTPQPTPAPEMFLPCGFEQSNCGWVASGGSSDMAWLRASGSHPVTKDAPLSDHTRLDQSGHYFISYPNNSDSYAYYYKSVSSTATSSYFWTTNRHCLVTVYYYVSDQATSSQKIEFGIKPFNSSSETVLWSPYHIADKKGSWTGITTEIGHQTQTFQFFLRHNIGYSWTMPGAIAFDDFTYIDCNAPPSQPTCPSYEFRCDNGACISKSLVCDGTDNCGDYSDESRSPRGGVCFNRIVVTFENQAYDDYYTYVAPIGTGDASMLWTFNSGSTPSEDTGPRFDHSFANATGHYYYLEASDSSAYSKAWLIVNATLSGSQSKNCYARFYYHMYGETIGSLTVYYRTEIDGPLTKMWSRSGEVGDVWLGATINLSDIKSDYQLIFEGQLGDSYEGDLALDDISFTEGCLLSDMKILPNYTTLSPLPSTTPAPCPTNSSLFSCYKSAPYYPCINPDYVCNFVADCPAGEDESPPFCVRNPTVFNEFNSFAASGWSPSTEFKFQFKFLDPKNIPPSCQGACPTTDFKGGSGKFVAADSSASDSYYHDFATLTQVWPGKSAGPQCQITFSYYTFSKKSASQPSIDAFILTPNPDNASLPMKSYRIWAIKASLQKWDKATIPIGLQPSQFYIRFETSAASTYARPAIAAVDNIAFENCGGLEPQASCRPDVEFHCTRSAACIDTKYMCDFGDHCGDGNPNDVASSSDEKASLCDTSYVARCAFDEPALACDMWDHDNGVSSTSQWAVIEARNAYSDLPEFDHTTHKPIGHFLLLNHEYHWSSSTARYKSTKRFAVSQTSAECHLRFWLYYYSPSNDIGTLYIMMRKSYAPLTESYLANYTSHLANVWIRQDILIPAEVGKPFEIVFYGVTGSTSSGGSIAIDDISMTPACHTTNILLPGQETISTTTFAPTCDEKHGSYKCVNSSGCYTLNERCDFINECDDGSDEASCSHGCSFDSESDWCNWRNSPDVKGKWAWADNKNYYPSYGPPGDHTTGSGGYLQTTAGYYNGDRARLLSTMFQQASPGCTLQFWYYAYYESSYYEPATLVVSVKNSKGIKEHFNQPQSLSLKGWQQANVTIYSIEAFEVRVEVIRKDHMSTEIAIDDLQWINCSPDSPPVTCLNPSDFLCDDASRCIASSKVCDFTADCRDGSDEDELRCRAERAPGSCTFENLNWQKFCSLDANATGDTLNWQGIAAGSIRNGPLVDHTLNTAQGRVIFVDTTSADVGLLETATLDTRTIFPADEDISVCYYRFYYYFYRAKSSRGLGKLKVMTLGNDTQTIAFHTQFSMLSIDAGSSTKDAYSDTWVYVNVPITRNEPFRVFLTAEVDDNPLSVMAVDDLSLSSSCITDRPARNNVTGCAVNEVRCPAVNITCIPSDFVCDGECDCPLCSDEASCGTGLTTIPLEPTGFTSETGITLTTPPYVTQTTTFSSQQPTTNQTTPNKDEGGSNDLGMILGITFGVVALLVASGVGAYFFYKHRIQGAAPSLVPGSSVANPLFGTASATSEDKGAVLLTEMPTTQSSSNDAIIDSTVNGEL